jgi:hypothetical protein
MKLLFILFLMKLTQSTYDDLLIIQIWYNHEKKDYKGCIVSSLFEAIQKNGVVTITFEQNEFVYSYCGLKTEIGVFQINKIPPSIRANFPATQIHIKSKIFDQDELTNSQVESIHASKSLFEIFFEIALIDRDIPIGPPEYFEGNFFNKFVKKVNQVRTKHRNFLKEKPENSDKAGLLENEYTSGQNPSYNGLKTDKVDLFEREFVYIRGEGEILDDLDMYGKTFVEFVYIHDNKKYVEMSDLSKDDAGK